MTNPTFQELLTSQEARDRAERFWPDDEHNGHWMNLYGKICESGNNPVTQMAIWQGYLQEAAPPPEPRVFKRVEYRPVFKGEGLYYGSFSTKDDAQKFGRIAGGMVACVRVEITAIEGQYDD